MAHGGELVLRAVALRAAAARLVRAPSGRHLPGVPPQRGARDHPRGPAGHLDHADLDRLGHPRSRGTPTHVFYVWYDALVNYITAIGYGEDAERFAKWWPAVHHLLGKDIIRFHCVWWPAMCMAAGIDPPAHFIVHGWLLVGGEKMSKSQAQPDRPGRARRRHRRRRAPLPPRARGGARLRRRLHLRGPRREVQLGPREQPRQSARTRRDRGRRASAAGSGPPRGRRRRASG